MPPVAVAAGLAVLAVAVAFAAWRWWPRSSMADGSAGVGVASGAAAQVRSASSPRGSHTASRSAGGETSATLVVHVVGAVRQPGVYALAASARVKDAVDAAGGALGNGAPDALNLARTLADGEQIRVPTKDEAASGAAPSAPVGGGSGGVTGAGGVSAGSPIDINAADASALDALPGVGPSTAAKIVADREANGPFKTADDLGRVSGIGPKKLEQLKAYICAR